MIDWLFHLPWFVDFVLIGVWLAALLFVAALCGAAGRGDRTMARCRSDVRARADERAAQANVRPQQRNVVGEPVRSPADALRLMQSVTELACNCTNRERNAYTGRDGQLHCEQCDGWMPTGTAV